jgi:arginase family enzyme
MTDGHALSDGPDYGRLNGWDREFEGFSDFDLPTYVGPSTFSNLPWVTDPAEIRRREVDVAIVGAPFDDAVSHRPGARFGPRAIREANYTTGSINSLQLGHVELYEVLTVVDAGDANVIPAWTERGHAFIYRKVREVAETGAIPIVLGGDHSITWPSATAIAEVRRPGSIGIVHFDAHADTAPEDWGVLAGHGTPMRRLIESGAVAGKNFVQVGLRGYWPPVDVFEWMKAQGMRWHFMRGGHRRRDRRGARRARRGLPLDRHRRHRPRDGARDRNAGTRRDADPRGSEGDSPDRRRGGPRRNGHRGGLAALRPRRDHGGGREPLRPRGDLGPGSQEGRGPRGAVQARTGQGTPLTEAARNSRPGYKQAVCWDPAVVSVGITVNPRSGATPEHAGSESKQRGCSNLRPEPADPVPATPAGREVRFRRG